MQDPILDQRLAARERPTGRCVMRQRWEELLFLHWEIEAAEIQAGLPPGLQVDTWGGRAYVGVVPFFMRRVRPAGMPPVPGISDFLELNLRTYVRDESGTPGVWFYSLDANRRLAVFLARTVFHLNYVLARMTARRDGEGFLHYSSTRRGGGGSRENKFVYRGGEPVAEADPGSLEFFLVERYRLFSVRRGRLQVGAVHHRPYPLARAEVKEWDDGLFAANGLPTPGRPPDHTLFSPGVDVEIFGLEAVPG